MSQLCFFYKHFIFFFIIWKLFISLVCSSRSSEVVFGGDGFCCTLIIRIINSRGSRALWTVVLGVLRKWQLFHWTQAIGPCTRTWLTLFLFLHFMLLYVLKTNFCIGKPIDSSRSSILTSIVCSVLCQLNYFNFWGQCRGHLMIFCLLCIPLVLKSVTLVVSIIWFWQRILWL